MRDALAGKVITLIDERDQDLIAAHDDSEERDDSIVVEHVAVNKKVLSIYILSKFLFRYILFM